MTLMLATSYLKHFANYTGVLYWKADLFVLIKALFIRNHANLE